MAFMLCAVLVAIVAILLYFYIVRTFTYWQRRGVPSADLWTNLADVFRPIVGLDAYPDRFKKIYARCKDHQYYGIYQLTAPVLLIRDQDLIKQVTVKDFDSFPNHRDMASKEVDPLWARNLFALDGEKWRAMRATLSPTFTGSKMRAMFMLIDQTAARFVEHYKAGPRQFSIECKDAFTRLSNDVIASCAFGIQVDSLKDRNNEFYLMAKEATNFGGFWRSLQFIISMAMPRLAQLIRVEFFPKNVRHFMRDIISRTIQMRTEQNIQRPDMIHLLMEARKGLLKHEEDNDASAASSALLQHHQDTQIDRNDKLRLTDLSDEDITAQSAIFIAGGFDTIASALCFIVHELTIHADIQQRLREEIIAAKEANGGRLTYDVLMRMRYMDMVVSEGMRKWTPGFISDRVCGRAFTLPASNANGKSYEVAPGDTILVDIIGVHYDPDIYPEPETFDPERFSEETRARLTPYNYMPFGVGPRHCIAIRFALMELKTALAHMLPDFEFYPTEKTNIPMVLSPSSFMLSSKNGFWLGMKRIH